jgi:hypothetical protein
MLTSPNKPFLMKTCLVFITTFWHLSRFTGHGALASCEPSMLLLQMHSRRVLTRLQTTMRRPLHHMCTQWLCVCFFFLFIWVWVLPQLFSAQSRYQNVLFWENWDSDLQQTVLESAEAIVCSKLFPLWYFYQHISVEHYYEMYGDGAVSLSRKGK